jgi:hypothetical protein
MITDSIRKELGDAYSALIFDYSDLEGLNPKALEEQMKCPLVELFDKQKNADKAKKVLKADFNKAVALYLATYQASSRIDFARLREKLDECEKVFLRHLGKDTLRYLRLLTDFSRHIKEKPKGLLGAA